MSIEETVLVDYSYYSKYWVKSYKNGELVRYFGVIRFYGLDEVVLTIDI